jgi:uncharacterized membrane protein YkvA (DUF1232 family)
MLARLKALLAEIRRDALVLWFAYRDPRTPLVAKILSVAVVAYALSPIDLIPDFIPILGYLDELIVMPLGIWLALKLMPDAVLADSRKKAREWLDARKPKPHSWLGAALVVLIWVLLAWAAWIVMRPAVISG